MRTKQEIQEKADWIREQIRMLKEMLNNRTINKYDENIYEVIYHFSDELNLLKWVLKEDQNEKEEGTKNS